MSQPRTRPLRIAVIGAGPTGLALALLTERSCPWAAVTVYDARPLDKDVSGDPRTLALALGSIQLLQSLQAWPESASAPIAQVHVSQAPPAWNAEAAVRISAQEQGVERLGAVLPYGPLVATLQAAWLARCAAEPLRCQVHFGHAVAGLIDQPDGVDVDAGTVDRFDLVVVAEGGVFADQARKAVTHDYRQTAWVGQVQLTGGEAGTAFERFTRHGPVALLPLPSRPSDPANQTRAALVWCVPSDDDPVAPLDDVQRRIVLQSLLPAEAGTLVELSPLKRFALGLNAERTLVEGRRVRVGNAAQTLHPVAGQGLNLGLRDAHTLVHALRIAQDEGQLRSAEGLASALRRVEWARAPDRWMTIATTDFLARTFTWNWVGLAPLRSLGLSALQALPAVKQRLARQFMFGRR